MVTFSSDQRGSRRRRAAVQEIGCEPDPRFTFANERTFLAWNRTGLALIATGLAIQQFLHLNASGVQFVIAAPLIVLGGLIAAGSYVRWERSERALRLSRPLPYPPLARPLAYGICAVAMAACVLLLVDTTLLR
jgi:putative membrane protein